MKAAPFHRRLRFALNGLWLAARRERSFRVHLVAMGGALGLLLVLRPAALWWAVVALASGLVLALELLNSALEALADRLHPDQHPEIRAAKDMAAAAVLVASMAAVGVAIALLLDRWVLYP